MVIHWSYGVDIQKAEYRVWPVYHYHIEGAPDPVAPVVPEEPAPGAIRDFDLNLFLGDAYVTPNQGMAPLEVQFFSGNPYDAIIEVSENFSYIIIETPDGEYIIREDPL